MERYKKIVLYSFATTCFRNVADADYISARSSYRLGLIDQFQWSSLQVIEKYLKAILLYNQQSAKDLGHDIEEALKRVENIETFDIDLEDYQKKLISHLNKNGQNRYLEQPSYTLGDELIHLDSTVWSLRRYCRDLNYDITDLSGQKTNLLDLELANNHSKYYKENPHKFQIIGGFLEKVLERKRSNDLRKALVWKNFYYGKYKKNAIKNFMLRITSYNPLYLRNKENFEFLSKYVNLPKRVKGLLKNSEYGI